MLRRINLNQEGTKQRLLLDRQRPFSLSLSFPSKDEFMIECPTVGELKKILIGHNNKGSAPGWFLDRVFIEDVDENRIYEFHCEKWFATDEDDGQISRYIFAKKGTGDGKQATAGKSSSLLSTCR